MSKHTADDMRPLTLTKGQAGSWRLDDSLWNICSRLPTVEHMEDESYRYGERIKAALEACAGIPTNSLKDGVVKELMERIVGAGRHQPMYNGRPSCPFCGNFVDDEETHVDGCVVLECRTALASFKEED